MAASAKDGFLGADAFTLGTDWDLIYGAAEIRDHAVFIDDAAPAFQQLIAIHKTELDSVEQCVRARVDVGDDGQVSLYARVELLEGGSPTVLDKCYIASLVQAAGAFTVTLQSLIASSALPISLASASLELDSESSQNVIFKVRDNDRGTKLDVFVNDEVTPVLSYVDSRNTRPNGLRVGFSLLDPDTDQSQSLADFTSWVLRSSVIKMTRPPIQLLSFGDLVHHVQYRLDRSGNSQFGVEYVRDFINFAQDEVYNELTPWKWAFRTLCFTTAANTALYELPAYVGLLYDMVDLTLGHQASRVTEQHLNRVNPLRSTTGGPYTFTAMGRGDFGGLVVRMDPVPSGQNVIELPYYAKPVPMEEDSDIPLIPTNFLEILVLGALKRAAMSDTDTAFQQQVSQLWERMMNRMKRANYTDMKSVPRMTTANELMRTKYAGLAGPVLRAQQLGL